MAAIAIIGTIKRRRLREAKCHFIVKSVARQLAAYARSMCASFAQGGIRLQLLARRRSPRSQPQLSYFASWQNKLPLFESPTQNAQAFCSCASALRYDAQGGIRTPVAQRAIGLQPIAIDHSATCAQLRC